MGTYRLLALDMDGTLLDSHKQILPRTLEALRTLPAKGVSVVLSTGRNQTELAEYLPQLRDVVRYGVTMSGALVYDFEEDRAIDRHPIPQDLALEALETGRRNGAMLHFMGAGEHGSVVERRDLSHMADYHMAVYQSMFSHVCTVVDDLPTYAREHPGAGLKINLYHRDPQRRDMSRAELAHTGLELADSETTSLEVSAPGVSKGEGLRTLCDHLGIPVEQTVAVGDAPNDLAVLGVAGLAVGMGNATPEVRAVADAIVADNDHDGIAEVVERFF